MLQMGDEMRRTQNGNNNAYCQDNDISWVNWDLLCKHTDINRFVRRLIKFRLSLNVFKNDHGMTLTQLLHQAKVSWHGVKLNQPDWSENSHSLSFTITGRRGDYHIILNSYWEKLSFELPILHNSSGDGWRRVIDTSLTSPDDFCYWEEAPLIKESEYSVEPRSIVLAISRNPLKNSLK